MASSVMNIDLRSSTANVFRFLHGVESLRPAVITMAGQERVSREVNSPSLIGPHLRMAYNPGGECLLSRETPAAFPPSRRRRTISCKNANPQKIPSQIKKRLRTLPTPRLTPWQRFPRLLWIQPVWEAAAYHRKGFKHRCSHMAVENGWYASRSSAVRMTVGKKCPRSFASEPNGSRPLPV